jgi:hypothetical protein
MEPLIMQFSPASYRFLLLRTKCSPKHSVLKPLQSVFSLNMTEYVSDAYKTIGRPTIIVYLFIQLIR